MTPAAAVGIVPTAIANVASAQGFSEGDSQLLTVMAYVTPLCSTLLLPALGTEKLTWRLLVGPFAIVAAAALSRAEAA